LTPAGEGDPRRGRAWRSAPPVLLAGTLVATLGLLPWLRATLEPPPGRAFVGFFYYVNDQYNYLSFVQQAEDGAFFFENKLRRERHPAVLVNLEWWLVGRLSAWLGRRPVLAYRLVGVAATFALLAAVDLWLRRSGLPAGHRLPALLLVALGGGLGGALFAVAGWPIHRCLDLSTGLFPFVGILANAHFLAGSALLVLSLAAYASARGPASWAGAGALGTALGLVRPYDLVGLVAIRGLGVALADPPRAWLGRLLPLAGLLPVAAYNYWVFYRTEAFAFYARAPYAFPPFLDFVPALGPATLLAATCLGAPVSSDEARRARRHLVAWAILGGLLVLARPVHFSLQFLVGIGVPVLALGALGLSRLRPGWTLIATAALGTTAIYAVFFFLLRPNPYYFVPAERLEAARALRPFCRPGDLALTPPDIGQYLAGLTACRAWVSHEIAPEHAERLALLNAFYTSMTPAERASVLDRLAIQEVLLPGDAGEVPGGWLGEATPFRRVAMVGPEGARLSLYARRPAPTSA